MSRKRDDAIYEGFCEIIPYTKSSVEVQVEDGEDDLGSFVIVKYAGMTSSKYYYE